MEEKCVDGTILLISVLKCEMLGYDLQTSTVTQRLMAGHVNRVMYIWLYKEKNFYPTCTNNHAVTQMVEALHHKADGCGFYSP